jgi:zinc/manganese transport system permease protein
VNLSAAELSILLPALAAGILVTATHVPLGTQVLARGIVFIDLAIAQIAGCGVLLADQLGFEPQGAAVQIAALAAALAGALLLTWTERIWPDVQEAVIGVTFVLGATGSVLLLASNVHGSEHLRDLLVGQILWVQWRGLAWTAAVYALVLAAWFGFGDRLGRVGVARGCQQITAHRTAVALQKPALGVRCYCAVEVRLVDVRPESVDAAQVQIRAGLAHDFGPLREVAL